MQNNTQKQYHRVTEIIRKFCDYENIPEYILDIASDRGNRVHALCEQYAKGEDLTNITGDIYPYVTAFVEWFDDAVDEVHFVEKRLYSVMSNFTGQIDLVVKIRGDEDYSVVDIKTTSSPHRSWYLQTAAYQLLCQENQIEINRRLVVHLKKCGSHNVLEYTRHIRDKELFLNALSLYNFFNCYTIIP